MLLCLNLKTQISHTSELAIDSMCQIDSQRYLHFFLVTGYVRLYKTISAIKKECDSIKTATDLYIINPHFPKIILILFW